MNHAGLEAEARGRQQVQSQVQPQDQPMGWTVRSVLSMGICTFGGLGLSPVAPATLGTLGGVLIAWLLAGSANFLMWTLLTALALYVLGRLVAPFAEERSGRNPGYYVLDEAIGYLVTIAWIGGPTLLTLFAAFVTFRFFDILKPPPIKWFERIRGGDGILLDDVVAGVYGLLAMTFLRLAFLEPSSWDVSLLPIR